MSKIPVVEFEGEEYILAADSIATVEQYETASTSFAVLL